MKQNAILFIMLSAASIAAVALSGCKTKSNPVEPAAPIAPARQIIASPMPAAVVYKMEGPATAANVPVTVNAQGNVVSFPDPIDVKGQEPIQLANGYLLDRRGINANSRFTLWTYADYAALPAAPSTAEIKAALIQGARVTEVRQLPMTLQQAEADTAAVNKIIKNF